MCAGDGDAPGVVILGGAATADGVIERRSDHPKSGTHQSVRDDHPPKVGCFDAAHSGTRCSGRGRDARYRGGRCRCHACSSSG